MAYQRKTRDEFNIEGNYGHGWDVVTCEETRKAARAQLRCYRENEPSAQHRIVKRRVRIEPADACPECSGTGCDDCTDSPTLDDSSPVIEGE